MHTHTGTCTQSFLRQLFTVDLPALMVLPKRLEINIPPSVTSIAEAAVGRDVIMRAVASAVLQVNVQWHTCTSIQYGCACNLLVLQAPP